MSWIILWFLIGFIVFPITYMFVEYVVRGTTVFKTNDFFIMFALSLIWPLGLIIGLMIFIGDDGLQKLGVRFPKIELDISKWVGKP